MKHSINVSIALLSMFLAAQIIGLFVVSSYVDVAASKTETEKAGKPVAVYEALPYNIERPNLAPDTSFIFLGAGIAVGTLLLLLIIKFRKVSLWKIWFSLAVVITLTVAFSSFLPKAVAAILSIIIAYFRVLKPNILAHNVGELFVYGGLAAIFVPIMNIKSATILILLVAAYDIFAVFKSKHMITLAKFQAENNMFAGLFVPKQLSLKTAVSEIKTAAAAQKSSRHTDKYSDSGNYAVIGGGDIGFPLLFAGVAMVNFGFFRTLLIPVFAVAALAILLAIGKSGKFYPAMPFIAAGCFIGYAIASVL
ncbi:MAG: presenilin family intramembrane aspartyl protease [Nanoarchaeota archaeon]